MGKGEVLLRLVQPRTEPSAVAQVCSLCLLLKVSHKKKKCTTIRSRDVSFVRTCACFTDPLLEVTAVLLMTVQLSAASEIPWIYDLVIILYLFSWEISGRRLPGFPGGFLERSGRCMVKFLHPCLKIALAFRITVYSYKQGGSN